MVTYPISEITFNDDIKFRRVERLPRLATGESIIMAFTALDDQGTPKIKDSFVHTLVKDKGHPQTLVIRAPNPKTHPDLAKRCVGKWGEPRIQFVTPVFKYASRDGDFIHPYSGQVYVFRFGQDKFPLLKQIHSDWGLGSVDVQVLCQEATFQKLAMQPKPGEAVWKNPECFNEEARAKILADSEVTYNALDNEIGRVLTVEQIEGLLDGIPLDVQNTQSHDNAWSPFSDQQTEPLQVQVTSSAPPSVEGPKVIPEDAKVDFSDVVDSPPPTVSAAQPMFGESTVVATVGGTPFAKPK